MNSGVGIDLKIELRIVGSSGRHHLSVVSSRGQQLLSINNIAAHQLAIQTPAGHVLLNAIVDEIIRADEEANS